jgi:hypothetical protein
MKNQKDLEFWIRKQYSTIVTSKELDQKILEKTSLVMDASANEQNGNINYERRFKMKIMYSKIVAAVVLTIGIVLGVSFLGSSRQSFAWAEVPQKMSQIDYFTYHKRDFEKSNGENEYRQTLHNFIAISPSYGQRMDSYAEGDPNLTVNISTFSLIKSKELIGIIYPMKAYSKNTLPESSIKNMKETDVRAMIEKWLNSDYKRLGRKVMDGHEVEGVEILDPNLIVSDLPLQNVVGYLWVDVKTRLPVSFETDYTMIDKGIAKERKSIADQFDWNATFTPEIFEPNIPSDYELIPR